jgi:hypothetical protein
MLLEIDETLLALEEEALLVLDVLELVLLEAEELVELLKDDALVDCEEVPELPPPQAAIKAMVKIKVNVASNLFRIFIPFVSR